jgi:hypothetical protein
MSQSISETENEPGWGLTPVILATQETDIRRISVQSQPRQTVLQTLSRKTPI